MIEISKMIILAIILTLNFMVAVSEDQPNADPQEYKIVCYLGSWANYRPGPGKFVIEDIDPFLCTHLIYGFSKLSNNRIAPYDPYLDLKENWGLGAYQRFNNLKKNNTKLKTIMAIGGWNEGSTKYSKMAANPQARKTFVDSCVEFLKKYEFDGLDLDWEYPANRGGSSEDKKNHVTLLKELKDEFKKHNFLLTAAVSAGKATIDTAYDIPAVSGYLDFINVMTYDFHGGWDKTTGINSPLYSRPDESENDKLLNTDFAINYWLKMGAPANKIIMGMPLYGRTFALQNSQNHGLSAPISGKGIAGPYTREPGFLGYNEICYKLKSEKDWTVVFDDNHKVPYAYKGRQWVGFDDAKSIGLKVDYIKAKRLGGGMVWSIETDDFKNYCGNGRYPLISIIKTKLFEAEQVSTVNPETSEITEKGSSSKNQKRDVSTDSIEMISSSSIGNQGVSNASTEVTSSSSEQNQELSTASTSVASSSSEETKGFISTSSSETIVKSSSLPMSTEDSFTENNCKEEGYFRNPSDCTKFYYCKARGDSGFFFYNFDCGPGTVYSQAIKVCTFPNDVPECKTGL